MMSGFFAGGIDELEDAVDATGALDASAPEDTSVDFLVVNIKDKNNPSVVTHGT
jgi:hypothetical protein